MSFHFGYTNTDVSVSSVLAYFGISVYTRCVMKFMPILSTYATRSFHYLAVPLNSC